VVSVTKRVPINLRIGKRVKRVYDHAVAEKYGDHSAYGGFTLEEELRAYLDLGDIATVWDGVMEVADALDVEGREKERTEKPPRKETTVCRYQVAKEVREQIIRTAEQEDYRSPGQFVEQIMWNYATMDGRLGRLADKLEDVVDEVADQESAEADTKAERIASRLDEAFEKDEFLAAAAEEGVTTTRYAVSEYLPTVMEIKDVYPTPHNSDQFVPRDSSVIDEVPDPAVLPYQAMTDEDKRLAIKAEALREVERGANTNAKLTAGDGVDVLGGRPNQSTVRALMRDIAAESDQNGFRYDSGEGALAVLGQEALAADYDNEDALHIAGLVEADAADLEDDGSDDESSTAPPEDAPGSESGSWVETVVEDVRDQPIIGIGDLNGAIAAATDCQPDEVTAEQRTRVIEESRIVEHDNLPDAYEYAGDSGEGEDRRPESDVTSYTAGSSPGTSFEDLAAGHPEQGGVADD